MKLKLVKNAGNYNQSLVHLGGIYKVYDISYSGSNKFNDIDKFYIIADDSVEGLRCFVSKTFIDDFEVVL